MVMSQGTYTFLTCFAGFWLIWGLIVLLCCFCSFLRRRLKRRQEERLREQHLRALELEPLELEGSLAGSPPGPGPGPGLASLAPQSQPPPPAPPPRGRLGEAAAHAHAHAHPLLHLGPAHAHPHAHPYAHAHYPHPLPHFAVPPRPWSYPRQTESDPSKPPCYEEAVLMAEPPPPYSEVLTDTRGLYRKIVTPFLGRRDSAEKREPPPPPPSHKPLFLERGYSAGALPVPLPLPLPSAPRPALGRRVFPSWADAELGGGREPALAEPGAWRLPVSVPLVGRTTAV